MEDIWRAFGILSLHLLYSYIFCIANGWSMIFWTKDHRCKLGVLNSWAGSLDPCYVVGCWIILWWRHLLVKGSWDCCPTAMFMSFHSWPLLNNIGSLITNHGWVFLFVEALNRIFFLYRFHYLHRIFMSVGTLLLCQTCLKLAKRFKSY